MNYKHIPCMLAEEDYMLVEEAKDGMWLSIYITKPQTTQKQVSRIKITKEHTAELSTFINMMKKD